ncbi:PaaI family thioesterase [Sphingomicrobium nitratireducens]|uniref:PaaI family thioesterase n=1 Tax=Sphingomicrobium nitratireducens TaxID=2964666 RepID=UPI00224046AD|nr:PaaI family thioesterase [Sphingomicrobium nitratireducens]
MFDSSRSGLEQLRSLIEKDIHVPMAKSLDFKLIDVAEGSAVFQGRVGPQVANPMGYVHGGYAATLLDSACGCAVHSALAPGQGYTSLEIKTSFLRPLQCDGSVVIATGKVTKMGGKAAFAEAELVDGHGRLIATATSTCLIFGLDD